MTQTIERTCRTCGNSCDNCKLNPCKIVGIDCHLLPMCESCKWDMGNIDQQESALDNWTPIPDPVADNCERLAYRDNRIMSKTIEEIVNEHIGDRKGLVATLELRESIIKNGLNTDDIVKICNL